MQTFSIEVWHLKNIKTPRKESWLPNSCQKGLTTAQDEHVEAYAITLFFIALRMETRLVLFSSSTKNSLFLSLFKSISINTINRRDLITGLSLLRVNALIKSSIHVVFYGRQFILRNKANWVKWFDDLVYSSSTWPLCFKYPLKKKSQAFNSRGRGGHFFLSMNFSQIIRWFKKMIFMFFIVRF